MTAAVSSLNMYIVAQMFAVSVDVDNMMLTTARLVVGHINHCCTSQLTLSGVMLHLNESVFTHTLQLVVCPRNQIIFYIPHLNQLPVLALLLLLSGPVDVEGKHSTHTQCEYDSLISLMH
jgi:hypothetical protein